mgnify:CR=1 FL=1
MVSKVISKSDGFSAKYRRAFDIDSELLSIGRVRALLSEIYSGWEIRYIMDAFNLGDFKVINDTHGLRANHCLSLARAEYFIQNEGVAADYFASRYVPRKIDFERYMAVQKPWIEEDAYVKILDRKLHTSVWSSILSIQKSRTNLGF